MAWIPSTLPSPAESSLPLCRGFTPALLDLKSRLEAALPHLPPENPGSKVGAPAQPGPAGLPSRNLPVGT
jgi:hypothetical protein